jgi:hypothetical protein
MCCAPRSRLLGLPSGAQAPRVGAASLHMRRYIEPNIKISQRPRIAAGMSHRGRLFSLFDIDLKKGAQRLADECACFIGSNVVPLISDVAVALSR